MAQAFFNLFQASWEEAHSEANNDEVETLAAYVNLTAEKREAFEFMLRFAQSVLSKDVTDSDDQSTLAPSPVPDEDLEMDDMFAIAMSESRGIPASSCLETEVDFHLIMEAVQLTDGEDLQTCCEKLRIEKDNLYVCDKQAVLFYIDFMHNKGMFPQNYSRCFNCGMLPNYNHPLYLRDVNGFDELLVCGRCCELHHVMTYMWTGQED